jgi:hypothetical protein
MSSAITAIVVSAISTVAGVVGAVEQKKQAKKVEKKQKEQARLQQRLATARAKRTARIKQAELLATTGGLAGTAITAPIIGAETRVGAQLDILEEQTELQIEQFGLQREQTEAAASAAIGQAIGSFASTVMTPTASGTSTLGQDALKTFKG